jgi:3',5'-cyclic AMP phosphodiesterase CpdA
MDPQVALQPLVADLHDRAGGLGFERLDYLVISGDVTNRATPEEFAVARHFVSGLIAEFKLTAERCIIVPGNHDLSWDEKVYHWKQQRRIKAQALKEGHYHKEGNLYLIRDERRYLYRFKNFSQHFYHPLMQREYPLNFEDQCIPYFFSKTGLQFITINSAWEIDEWFQQRSSINPSALARGLAKAKAELGRAWRTGKLSWNTSVLRIGVWHHPVTGNDKIRDDAFMGRLRQAGVRLCLHGHVHEERMDLFGYLHRRRIYIVGTGSFGAPAATRPESTPRLYNLLEIAHDHSAVKVHTRWMRKEGGSWEGWAIWPSDDSSQRRTYYVIDL